MGQVITNLYRWWLHQVYGPKPLSAESAPSTTSNFPNTYSSRPIVNQKEYPSRSSGYDSRNADDKQPMLPQRTASCPIVAENGKEHHSPSKKMSTVAESGTFVANVNGKEHHSPSKKMSTVAESGVVSLPMLRKLGPEYMTLLVGEGDFSFSASLAVTFGDASNLVATSLDTLEILKENYKRAEVNIKELTSRGCKVIHGVDATTMANHPQLESLKFEFIVFNFPYATVSDRKSSRDAQIRKHQELVRGFLANAKKMIQGDGQIHITNPCSGHFLEWNIKMLGLSEGLRLVEDSAFDSRDYAGYCAKFGCGGDGSFGCNPAKTYKFQLVSTKGTPKQMK